MCTWLQVAPCATVVNVTQMAGQWIGKKVRKGSQSTEQESAVSSESEEERANLSLPVKRARRDYSKPKYFECLMSGECCV